MEIWENQGGIFPIEVAHDLQQGRSVEFGLDQWSASWEWLDSGTAITLTPWYHHIISYHIDDIVFFKTSWASLLMSYEYPGLSNLASIFRDAGRETAKYPNLASLPAKICNRVPFCHEQKSTLVASAKSAKEKVSKTSRLLPSCQEFNVDVACSTKAHFKDVLMWPLISVTVPPAPKRAKTKALFTWRAATLQHRLHQL